MRRAALRDSHWCPTRSATTCNARAVPLEALLAASIRALNTGYGPFAAPPNPAALTVTATPPPGLNMNVSAAQ